MLDLSDFLFIDTSLSRIGIEKSEAVRISSNLSPGKIKKEHVEASSPPLQIALSSFYISKKLVTVSEFTEFVNATSYISDSEREGWGWVWENSWKKRNEVSWIKPFGNDTDNVYQKNKTIFPVMQVSWNDAVAYTAWKSSVEGKTIRIPSEAEWEIFADKAGVKSISEFYQSGEGEPVIIDSKDFVNLLETELSLSCYQLGLLWEWTLDWYESYSSDNNVKDFGNVYKVLRGGSLLSEEIQKTREFRFRRCPTARSPYYSFRIVYMPE